MADRCPVCGERLRPIEAFEGFHRYHFDTRDPYRNRSPAEVARRLLNIADGEPEAAACALRVAARMVQEHLVLNPPAPAAPQVDVRQGVLELG